MGEVWLLTPYKEFDVGKKFILEDETILLTKSEIVERGKQLEYYVRVKDKYDRAFYVRKKELEEFLEE